MEINSEMNEVRKASEDWRFLCSQELSKTCEYIFLFVEQMIAASEKTRKKLSYKLAEH